MALNVPKKGRGLRPRAYPMTGSPKLTERVLVIKHHRKLFAIGYGKILFLSDRRSWASSEKLIAWLLLFGY